jgi:hypothetical protein
MVDMMTQVRKIVGIVGSAKIGGITGNRTREQWGSREEIVVRPINWDSVI